MYHKADLIIEKKHLITLYLEKNRKSAGNCKNDWQILVKKFIDIFVAGSWIILINLWRCRRVGVVGPNSSSSDY